MAQNMSFQQIRSAAVIVSYPGVRFLVDPWLGPKDSCPPFPGSPRKVTCPLRDLPMPVEEICKVDAVVVTHLHFDHFDETAKNALDKNLPMFVQDEIDAKTVSDYGFKDVRVLKYEGVTFRGVEMIKTDCLHAPCREVVDQLYATVNIRKEASGVIFRYPNQKALYIVGDSIWCDEVKKAIDQYHPDIIVLNACQATVEPFGRLIMGLDDIREVLKAAPDATLIASHMDTVCHATVFRSDIRKFIAEEHLESRLLLPDDGEIYNF